MITRRHALRALGAMCTLPCVEACASQRSYRTQVKDDAVRVPADQLGHLRGPVDALTVRTARTRPILVRRLGGDQFVAVDARCPHSGCNVRPEPDGYVCPCHGSAFAAEGDVINGPAAEPLRRYATEVADDTLVIRLQ